MKKRISIVSIIMIILITFMLVTNTYAEEKVIKVGYVKEYNIIRDIESVDSKGYGYDLFNKIDNYTNHKYEYIECTYESGLDKLRTGELDIFAPVTYTQERDNEFYYSEEIFATEEIILAVDNEYQTLYDDEEKMNGKKVFTKSYSGYIEEFEEYLSRKNIEMQYIYSDVSDEVEQVGDYYLTSSLNYIDNLKSTAVVGEINSYLISNESSKGIIDEIDEALRTLKEEDPMIIYNLHEKYYEGTKLSQKDFTKEQIEYTAESDGNSYTEVAVNINQKPISYINEEGELDGIGIKIMELLSETYNFEISYLMYDISINTKEEIEEIYNNSDISISQINDYDKKSEEFSVTNPYMYINMMTIMKEDTLHNLEGESEKLGVLGTFDYDTFDIDDIQEEYINFDIVIFDSIDEMIEKYNNEEIQAILITEAEANTIINKITIRNTQIYSTSIEIPLRIFVDNSRGEAYLEVYNIMFQKLDDSILQQIKNEELEGFKVQRTILRWIQEYTPELVLIALVIVLIISYFRNRKKKKILSEASKDKLTGLDSLIIFYQKLDKLIERAKENEYIILTIDMDAFRVIRETYGDEKVSNVIKSVGEELKEKYSKDNLISRIANDVFVLVIKNEQSEMDNIVKDLIKTYNDGLKKELPKTYNVNVSVGAYIINDKSETLHKMIDDSSMARREGKQLYKNTFHIFNNEMRKKYENENKIVQKMKKALEEREFIVVYQPKVSLKTLKMESSEALVRWVPKDGNMIYPDEFIPVFEKNGFITNLDYYVFEEVCKVLSDNRELHMPLIAVNISAITLIEDITPVKMIEILNKYNIKTSNIQIEITESAFVREKEIIKTKFEQLKELGFSVAIDDFGAGISSLNRLNDLNADVIKIDKGFLDNSTERGNIIIESVIRMANKLNIKVVTEGVETKEQVELLKALGCNEVQGYYFDKPLTKDIFLKNIIDQKIYKI